MAGETNELSGRANSLVATFWFWLGSIVFGIHIAAEGAITASPTSYEHGPFAFVIGTCMVSVFLAFMAIAFLIAVIVSPKTPKRDSRRLYWLSGALGAWGRDSIGHGLVAVMSIVWLVILTPLAAGMAFFLTRPTTRSLFGPNDASLSKTEKNVMLISLGVSCWPKSSFLRTCIGLISY
ncbi:MAG: hypothetical protein H8E44_24115 [Planctomycetes bacterium]|nr:hypothetical protein [Planctomycetota bacterium]MBL7042437.1 hypothetical protein [Pirellulaceae bacterium]